MLSDADKETCASDAGDGGWGMADKLLFSQGRTQRTRSCNARLMQSSETVFAFGVPSPSKHTPGSQQTVCLTSQIDPRSQSLLAAFCHACECRRKAQSLATQWWHLSETCYYQNTAESVRQTLVLGYSDYLQNICNFKFLLMSVSPKFALLFL